ncbi:ROK family protein [Elusimicrobiota bacterium]
MSKYYLGIDLGGTEVKIAIVDGNGLIQEETSVANNKKLDHKKLIRKIIARVKALKYFQYVSGAGVGVAGDIDQVNGVVRFSPNLPLWKKVPLEKILKKHLSCPVVIDNDANVAALGAYFLDAKSKVNNLICVTLGTGVGGGIILDGKVYRGSTGSAGEIGHMPYDPEGLLCSCGSYGCIEKYIGASSLSEYAKNLIKAKGSKIITKLVNGSLNEVTPKVLAKAAEMGDVLAKTIWKEAGSKLGIVLAGVINLLNPEIIVISGGISNANNFLLKHIRDEIRKRAFKTSSSACKVIVSKYTHKLGVVGAALLAK